jgi:hypothetical protein
MNSGFVALFHAKAPVKKIIFNFDSKGKNLFFFLPSKLLLKGRQDRS